MGVWKYGNVRVWPLHDSLRVNNQAVSIKLRILANGVIHEFIPDRKITRTFEMENAPFGKLNNRYDKEHHESEG